MEQLFGAIPSVLMGLGTDDGAREALVFAAWKRCAGDLLGERTEPLDFFENRLVVAVGRGRLRLRGSVDLLVDIASLANRALLGAVAILRVATKRLLLGSRCEAG